MTFLGIARGGPKDGHWIDWDRPEYVVPYLPPQRATWFKSDQPPPDRVFVLYGTYRHVLGQWIWDADHQNVRMR